MCYAGAEAPPSWLPPTNKCSLLEINASWWSPLTNSGGPFQKHTLRLNGNPIQSHRQDRGPCGAGAIPGTFLWSEWHSRLVHPLPSRLRSEPLVMRRTPPPHHPLPGIRCSGPSRRSNLQNLIHFRHKNPGGGGGKP